MWYATQQPRQQFVLEEVIAYDAPLAGLGFLGRGGRYARAMQAIQPLKGVPRGRVIVPESPVAVRQEQAQSAISDSYQPAALPVARQGKQFSDALWQDPRITAMMQPDPRTGWAQMTIGPARRKPVAQKPAGAEAAKKEDDAWLKQEAYRRAMEDYRRVFPKGVVF